MSAQPEGTVTMVFTDIEGSTRLLAALGNRAYSGALDLHRRLLREAFERNDGYEVDCEGDAFFVAFARAEQALAAVAEAQAALAAARWPDNREVRVRIGVHTGEPLPVPPKYVGIDVHRAARIMAAAHGGQVLVSQVTRDLLADRLAFRDLGEHRLKDLSAAQRLYQLGSGDFPAVRSLHHASLPTLATPFLGRVSLVDEARALLTREEIRVLTLSGPGGTGKTRLALEVASRAADEFAHGVFFVALEAIDDPSLVARTIGRTLGLSEQPDQTMEDALAAHLDGKRVLLLLDNFEQVLGAAALLSTLTGSSPGVTFLVTSRARLRLRGEVVLEVPPLSLPVDVAARLDLLARNEAGALFLERAEAADRSFAPTDDDAAAIAEICVRLDGLPLALELAAARVTALTPQALLARLERRLPLLTLGPRDAHARQQTLRDTVEWSYDLLAEPEQRLFARLSVFAGGCRLDAAEVVCDAGGDLGLDVLDGLTSLAEKSLLHRRDDADREPRFVMLETIREYAAERLEQAGEADRLRRSHAEWCHALVTRAEPELVGRDQGRWRDRLDADHANLRSALTWAVDREPATALSLASRLQEYWEPRGFLREGRETLELVLQATPLDRTAARADALAAAGWFAFLEGDLARAEDEVRSALGLAAEIGYERGRAVALAHRGWIAYYRDEYATAVACGDESRAILHALDAPLELAEALALLGNIAVATGAYDDARALLQESAALSRAQENASALAYRLGDLGFVDRLEGELTAARARFEESLGLTTVLQLKSGRVYALLNLAAIARGEDAAASRALAEEALSLARELGERSAVAQALTALAEAALAAGKDGEAEALLREALSHYAELEDRLAVVGLLEKLALVAVSDDRVVYGVELAAAASTLRRALDFHRRTPESSALDAIVADLRSQPAGAFEAAWSRGSELELAQAVAKALDAPPATSQVTA